MYCFLAQGDDEVSPHTHKIYTHDCTHATCTQINIINTTIDLFLIICNMRYFKIILEPCQEFPKIDY